MTRIYTRTGDAGETSLFGGQRVRKDALRVEAYGAIDELNAALGLARSLMNDTEMDGVLECLQRDLFVLGADLATPFDPDRPASRRTIERVSARAVEGLEKLIDRDWEEVERVNQFVLPGGTPAASTLHLVRTICRRAERRAVTLAEEEQINGPVLVYLNRLSDLLFALARLANQRAGVEERLWMGLGETS